MKHFKSNRCLLVFLAVSFCFQLAGCCKKRVRKPEKAHKPIIQSNEAAKEVVSEESEELLNKTGLKYSIDNDYIPAVERKISLQPSSLGNFEKNYLQGVEFLEADKFDQAMAIFQELLKEYPDGEEASIASLCIAEIFFRSKNNEAALKMYKEIIVKYPGTQAAMNAAEGIKYLTTFEKYEKNYIAPEQEDRKRR